MCVVELQRPRTLRCIIERTACQSESRFPFAKGVRKTRMLALGVGDRSSMVELQIVVLAVAGSSPVGHPDLQWHVRCLKTTQMLNPAVVDFANPKPPRADFWNHLVNDESLRDCDDLEKLVIGCELIAALDAVALLAA